jgi:cell division septation protein DedD
MSAPVTIQLSRGRAIALAGCLLGAALFLFVAGTATGLLVASQAADTTPSTAPKRLSAETALPAKPEEGTKPDASEPPDDAAARPAEDAPAAVPTNSSAPESRDSQPRSGQASDAGSSKMPAPQATSPKPVDGLNAHSQEPSAIPASEPTEENRIPLAVKVCSFASKASADKMVASLAEHGYQASLTHSLGADGRGWYVVKLGPYSEWDAASSVAAKVAIAENVRPMVGPLR